MCCMCQAGVANSSFGISKKSIHRHPDKVQRNMLVSHGSFSSISVSQESQDFYGDGELPNVRQNVQQVIVH